jgi:murein DD-endopeptidase MepM/ murein hydrolase activator NlpD
MEISQQKSQAGCITYKGGINLKRLISLLIIGLLTILLPANAMAYSYTEVFANVPPQLMQWPTPLPTWATINSKWNQPRSTGTNPHRGIDLAASVGTTVTAVWSGWLSQIGSNSNGIDATFQLDLNNNGIKDDAAYYVNYYHLNTISASGYYSQGKQIGTSGYPTAPHLHYGGTSAGSYSALWYRNEVNYRWTSNWNYGKDVDSFAVVSWNTNSASLTAYFKSNGTILTPAEVRIFHRKNGTSTWTDGATGDGSRCVAFSFIGIRSCNDE